MFMLEVMVSQLPAELTKPYEFSIIFLQTTCLYLRVNVFCCHCQQHWLTCVSEYPVCSGHYLSKMVQGMNGGELSPGSWAANVWSNPIDELLLLSLLKNLMLVRLPMSTAESVHNRHMSNGRRWLVLINHVFFYITCIARRVCMAYLGNIWYQDALWEECADLSNVLLGTFGSCHPCGSYFDMYHRPKHCC